MLDLESESEVLEIEIDPELLMESGAVEVLKLIIPEELEIVEFVPPEVYTLVLGVLELKALE